MNPAKIDTPVIRITPAPFCPDCGAVMKLRRPHGQATWAAFWGCSGFPKCSGSREIMPNGDPEDDRDTLEEFIGAIWNEA